MSKPTTEQLQTVVRNAERTLDGVVRSLESNTDLQSAVRGIVQADGAELERFERLIAEDRGLANQVLFASVGALVNLQASRAAQEDLKRRTEAN